MSKVVHDRVVHEYLPTDADTHHYTTEDTLERRLGGRTRKRGSGGSDTSGSERNDGI